MGRKRYSSFEHIDQELELLQLQNELLRIRIRHGTGQALGALSPGRLLLDSLGPLGSWLRRSGGVQQLVTVWLMRWLLKRSP